MLCWADYLGLLWAFIVYFVLFVLIDDKAAALAMFASPEGLKLPLVLVFPVWVVLRLLDAAFGGPRARRIQRAKESALAFRP